MEEIPKSYNMQRIIIVLFGILVLTEFGNAQIEGVNLYSRRYEKLDVDTILASPRLVMNYVDCLLNKKPCPPEGKDLKRILPEALRTKCSRCWPSQKEGAIKVITKLYYDYPTLYKALRAKWDATGEYHRRFEEYLRDQQFNVITDNVNDITGDQSEISVSVSDGIIVNNRFGGFENTDDNQRPTVVQQQPPSTTRTRLNLIPNQTQRPTRQDIRPSSSSAASSDYSPILNDELLFPSQIGNRFGDENEIIQINTKRRTVPASPSTSSSSTKTTKKTTKIPTKYNRKTPAVTKFVYEPVYQTSSSTDTVFFTRNPILNLLTTITQKFSNTAEIIAGMFRTKVKILQALNNDNNNNNGGITSTTTKRQY